MNKIIELLLDTGLVLFDLFPEQGKALPIKFNWQYLPAYPEVVAQLITLTEPFVNELKPDRLLAPCESLPFGLALSLKTGIPLIYERGSDLVGAYDTGHTVLLVTNEQATQEVEELIQRARQVGLKISAGFSLVSIYDGAKAGSFAWLVGLRMKEMTRELVQGNQLSRQQGEAIQHWIAQQEMRLTPHPDSGAP